MNGILFGLTLLTCLGCGLNAGVFFAFSSFVMKGLVRLPPAQGIAAMQSINVTAVRPAFMTALFATAVGCAALIVRSIIGWDEPYSPYLLAGGGLYLVGAIGLTAAYHVPRNDALDRVQPGGADAARQWSAYAASWTRANHLRTAMPLAASALLALALTMG